MGKRFSENLKQIRSSQNISDSRKSEIFYDKKIGKGNYETISFEKRANIYIYKITHLY